MQFQTVASVACCLMGFSLHVSVGLRPLSQPAVRVVRWPCLASGLLRNAPVMWWMLPVCLGVCAVTSDVYGLIVTHRRYWGISGLTLINSI